MNGHLAAFGGVQLVPEALVGEVLKRIPSPKQHSWFTILQFTRTRPVHRSSMGHEGTPAPLRESDDVA